MQYSVNGSRHILDCEVEYDDDVIVTWQKENDTNSVKGPFIIESVQLSDEGIYTCSLYFPSMDVSTTRNIHLSVVGELE